MNNRLFSMFLSFNSGMTSHLLLSNMSFWLMSLNCSNSHLTLPFIFHLIMSFRAFVIIGLIRFILPPLDSFIKKITKRNISQRVLGFTMISIGSILTIIMTYMDIMKSRIRFVLILALISFFISNGNLIFFKYNISINPKDELANSINTKFYSIGSFMNSIFILINDFFNISWPVIFRYVSFFTIISFAIFMLISPDEKNLSEDENIDEALQDFKVRNKWLLIQQLLLLVFFNMQHRLSHSLIKPYIRSYEGLTKIQFFLVSLISQIFTIISIDRYAKIFTNHNPKKTFIEPILLGIITPLLYLMHSLRIPILDIFIIIISFTIPVFLYNMPKIILLFIPIAIISPYSYYPFFIFLGILFIDKVIHGIRLIVLYSYKMSLCTKQNTIIQLSFIENLEIFINSTLQIYSGYILQYVLNNNWSYFFTLNVVIAIIPLMFFINPNTKFYKSLGNKKD